MTDEKLVRLAYEAMNRKLTNGEWDRRWSAYNSGELGALAVPVRILAAITPEIERRALERAATIFDREADRDALRAEVQASEAEAALWRVAPNVHTVGDNPDPFEGPGETYADAYRRVEAERDALRAEVERHRSEPLIKSIERILDEHSAWISAPNPEVTKAVALAAGIAGTEANRQAASEYERHLEAEVERLRAPDMITPAGRAALAAHEGREEGDPT